MSVLKLVGVLLDYPREELWQHGEELLAACDDPALNAARRQQLRSFGQQLLGTDARDAQAAGLASFDRGRSMSLLLFEHINGESRDRGQAMVDLVETYRRNGFELDARELPDYLPLLQRELLEVIKKYVNIDVDAVKVDLVKDGQHDVLDISVALPEGPDKP
ncbi:hypothetical protein G6F60_014109 [Rhizopus arrhizus]|nr:hypothetical protein G6F60_014109 [Rhizopus arrhizus]